MHSKLQIKGAFSNEEMLGTPKTTSKRKLPKHQIPPHPGFEVCELPNGKLCKFAYSVPYPIEMEDVEIEAEFIRNYEPLLLDPMRRKEAKEWLKFHYKKFIALIDPVASAGWNRWSDYMLELFINEKTHKVIWGSGNCGKSFVMGVLLYTKWRVNPTKRMIVIASKVVKEAEARVFGYIKKIHTQAPRSKTYKFKLVDSQKEKAIYVRMFDKTEKKWVNDSTACIVSLPIKTNSVKEEIGANLLGKHPEDRLVLAFDEGQELPGKLLEERIFLNWYTNARLDVYGWGNPTPVDFHSEDSHDLLFKLGAGGLALSTIRAKAKHADRTTTWTWSDTAVLHLSMLDSPKDDDDEKDFFIERSDGTSRLRLSFLGGKDTAQQILQKSSPNSPAYFSQVLGFPWIDTENTKHPGVLTPTMVRPSREYPLRWRTPANELRMFMGVDPAITGYRDTASISVGAMGMMVDGRWGIDCFGGEHFEDVKVIDDEEFTDSIIHSMYRKSVALRIPLNHIALETHGVGEVIRYAIQKFIESGEAPYWKRAWDDGLSYMVISPNIGPTDRDLFKSLGRMVSASEMVTDIASEYYMAVRCAFLNRQIFNVPERTLKEFYNRFLLLSANGKKFKVEGKDQMKARGVSSPSRADSLCNLVEIMRRFGFKYKFYDKAGYTEVFGEEFDRRNQRAKIENRLQIATALLNMGVDFGKDISPLARKRKREPVYNIAGV